MGCYISPWAQQGAHYDWGFIVVTAAIALVVITAVGFLRETAAALASWWTQTQHDDNGQSPTPTCCKGPHS